MKLHVRAGEELLFTNFPSHQWRGIEAFHPGRNPLSCPPEPQDLDWTDNLFRRRDGCRSMLRKAVAQVGVLLFIASMLEGVFSPFLVFLSGWLSVLPFAVFESGILVLLIASVLPSRREERWGSMWPLVGYDNVIDAIYVRGPWWARFDELEEQERVNHVTEGMSTLFGTERGQGPGSSVQ